MDDIKSESPSLELMQRACSELRDVGLVVLADFLRDAAATDASGAQIAAVASVINLRLYRLGRNDLDASIAALSAVVRDVYL